MNPLDNEQRLTSLLRAYHDSCAFQESADFLPRVWERIEARRANTALFRRVARIFATGTAALAILVATVVSVSPAVSPDNDDTWVETLASDNVAQVTSYPVPVHFNDSAHSGVK